MNELIKVEHLTKRYNDFALSDASLYVEPGRVVGLIGSNGAGKTTMLKAILGLISVDEGAISLFGIDSGKSRHTVQHDIDSVKERIGVVFDTCAFLTTMYVKDVEALGRASYSKWDSALFEKLCKRFDLGFKKRVKDLSRGMGMKLTLAFALAHHPDILILDEATAGLDPLARDEILDILRDFMSDENHGILMATHITTDLEKIADEVVCIDNGRILFSMPKDAICDEAGIVHCRKSDIDRLQSSGWTNGQLKTLSHGYGVDVLVPERLAFASKFDDIPVERVSIEEYMTLTLKGESL